MRYSTADGSVRRLLDAHRPHRASAHPAHATSARSGRGEWTSREMMKLSRSQLTQQLNGTELDDVSILTREGSLCQQRMNGFAGADETFGFFPHMVRHDGTPYE